MRTTNRQRKSPSRRRSPWHPRLNRKPRRRSGRRNSRFAIARAATLLLFAIAAPAIAAASELEQAASLEKSGHPAQAVALYRKWLTTNPPSSTWDDTLLRTVDLMADPQRAASELLDALPKLSSDSAKHQAYIKVGQLDELLGDLTGAQESFQNASLVPGSKDFASLLESARILVQLGRLAKADAQARSIVATCQDPSVVSQARALLVKIDAVVGRADRAREDLAQLLGGPSLAELSPGSLVELYEACDQLGLSSQKTTVARLLAEYYPKSPENAVINGKASAIPSPARLLGFSPGPYEGAASPRAGSQADQPSPTAVGTAGTAAAPPSGARAKASQPGSAATIDIQIGSYRDPTNADYRLQDLKNAGFLASVVKTSIGGKTYYRVVVPKVPVGKSQDELIKLKEQGFEGFLLYD